MGIVSKTSCALGVGFLLVGAVGHSVLLASIGVAFLALSLALVVSFGR
jgi:hypothetical protein